MICNSQQTRRDHKLLVFQHFILMSCVIYLFCRELVGLMVSLGPKVFLVHL